MGKGETKAFSVWVRPLPAETFYLHPHIQTFSEQ